MDPVQPLFALEEAKRLHDLDLRGVDTQVWAGWEGMERNDFQSTHRFDQPEAELESKTRASGSWQIEHTGDERVWEQFESRKDRPGLKLTASMWTRGGANSIPA